jgi:hypothetical protein
MMGMMMTAVDASKEEQDLYIVSRDDVEIQNVKPDH